MIESDFDTILPCTCGSNNIEQNSGSCSEYYGKCIQYSWIECKDCGREIFTEFDHNIDGDPEAKECQMIKDWNEGK